MKKLLLCAVVLSGLALTSCTKTRECHCEWKNNGTTVQDFHADFKGKCEDYEYEGVDMGTLELSCSEE